MRKAIWFIMPLCFSLVLSCQKENAEQSGPIAGVPASIDSGTRVLPKLDLSENIFATIPAEPSFFKSDNSVQIVPEKAESNSGDTPIKDYYGNTVLVKGQMFEILYSANGSAYRVQKVVISGTSFLPDWSSLIGLDKQVIKTSWGDPSKERESFLLYTSNLISTRLYLENNKVIRVEFYREP